MPCLPEFSSASQTVKATPAPDIYTTSKSESNMVPPCQLVKPFLALLSTLPDQAWHPRLCAYPVCWDCGKGRFLTCWWYKLLTAPSWACCHSVLIVVPKHDKCQRKEHEGKVPGQTGCLLKTVCPGGYLLPEAGGRRLSCTVTHGQGWVSMCWNHHHDPHPLQETLSSLLTNALLFSSSVTEPPFL